MNMFEAYHELSRVWNHPFMLKVKQAADIECMLSVVRHCMYVERRYWHCMYVERQ